ncbi:MAG: MFS transporter [Oscillospiraceae bacterium]
MNTNFKKLKAACYTTNMSMSVVGNLSPLLFITFRSLYGISYSLLGLLVLINFCTQLIIDLVFSFYSYKFNIAKTVKLTPVFTAVGLFIYAVYPFLFPNSVYIGLVIGTVIFAVSGGLAEVLISPVIAAIPSENPDREMSRLHSVYAWGVVLVVVVSTLFLFICGKENWQWLAMFWLIIPVSSSVLFAKSDIPPMPPAHKASGTLKLLCNKGFLLCFFCIFFGGASECIMAQWSSGYLEQAFAIPKVLGDVMGVALFAVMLGIGRTLYARRGKNINAVLLIGASCAVVCYLTAALSNIAVIGLAACALTGLCTAMLWPGSLIVASDKFAHCGLSVFALMAAGGDLGGSVGPQLVGVITDTVINSEKMSALALTYGLSAEQLGMKIGVLSATIFPLSAAILYAIALKSKNKSQQADN